MPFYTEIHDEQKFRLGTKAKSAAGVEYVYARGAANVAAGTWVNLDVDPSTGIVTILDIDTVASLTGRVAVAQAAVVANKYGWFAVYGNVTGKTLTGATDVKNAFATSTGGSVDDSGAGAEVLIFGAFYTSAADEEDLTASFFINYPFVTGLTLD